VSILDQLIGGNLGQVFKDVVSQFHLSPEDKAKMQAAIDENQKEIQLAQLALETKAQEQVSAETTAALDAYKAEQTTDDGYTKHWRPTFGYMVTLLLFWNYAIVPLFGRTPVTIPDRLFEMFGALLLVAIGGRSFEKIFGAGK
jgi:Holin of 3TMs, for gene-transfer release